MENFVFVIPAYNEEAMIGKAINSIYEYSGAESEIIVIDNGSSDETVAIAKELGASVYVQSEGTIGALRNYGVSKSEAENLVFIDADVTLTKDWESEICNTVIKLSSNPRLITGSHCAPPESNNFLLKYWFKSFADEADVSHLGTGHLIVQKGFFDSLGGFNEGLSTGEDYEFCQRAVASGAAIVNNHKLKVYHHDFPKDLVGFMKREAWHGVGDLVSIKAMAGSKVFIASIVFLALNILFLIGLYKEILLTVLSFVLMLVLCALSSFVKYRDSGFRYVLINSFIFYFYYLGRVGSLWVKSKDLFK